MKRHRQTTPLNPLRSSRALKGAIIGFGAVAEDAHLPAFQRSRSLSIIAVADNRPERRRLAARLLPGVRVYEDLKDLLRAEKEVDFVDIATPPFLHAGQVFTALESGRHVLCEKPLALDLDQFERIRDEAARSQRAVFTVHNWKHAPLFQKLRELATSGIIGSVRHIELHVLRSQPAANRFSVERSWRTDAGLAGGGILMDHGWHAFYLLGWLLGAPPLSAAGHLRFPKSGEAEEEAACLLQYSQTSAMVFLTWKAAARSNRGILYGEAGTIEIADDRLILTREGSCCETLLFPTPLSKGSAHPDWFHDMLPDFEAALSEPARRQNNLIEVQSCLKILEMLYRQRPSNPLGRESQLVSDGP